MASEMIKTLKRIIYLLIIVIAIIVIGFLHYLSLYDFTNTVDQHVDKVDNSSIEQNNN